MKNDDTVRVVRLSKLVPYAKTAAECCVCGKHVTNRDVMSAYYDGRNELIDVDGEIMSARYFIIKCLDCVKCEPVTPLLVIDDRLKEDRR